MQFIYMFKVHTNPLTCTLRNRLDTDAKKIDKKGIMWLKMYSGGTLGIKKPLKEDF